MVDISRKRCNRNNIEINGSEIMWLTEKHIKEGLMRNDLWEIITKYHSDHKKHKYKLVDESKKHSNRIFVKEKLALKVIMDCRTIVAHKLKQKRLGFKLYDVTLTKE